MTDALSEARRQQSSFPDTEARRQRILTYRAILDSILGSAEWTDVAADGYGMAA